MEQQLTEDNYQALQKELLEVIHFFHSKGWSPATSTNYSFRNPASYGNTYTISSSGVDKGSFTSKDLMIVDAKGNPTRAFNHMKPSAETLLHTMIYRQFATDAILHTHSVYATVLSAIYRKNEGIYITGYEVLKGLKGIKSHEEEVFLPIFPNSQDMPKLSKQIEAYARAHSEMRGFLLAGHGLYTWGNSIAEAKRHVEAIEFLLECIALLQNLNKY